MDDTQWIEGLRSVLNECSGARVDIFAEAVEDALRALEPEERRQVVSRVVGRIWGVQVELPKQREGWVEPSACRCRICDAEGPSAVDQTRCSNCFRMGIVGFDRGRVLTETPITTYIAEVVEGLCTKERVLAMSEWLKRISAASARSEIAGRNAG